MREESAAERERRLESIIEKRIQDMESPKYEYPKRFSRADYGVAVGVAAVCLAVVIIGAFF